jgi:hypothetical protein
MQQYTIFSLLFTLPSYFVLEKSVSNATQLRGPNYEIGVQFGRDMIRG